MRAERTHGRAVAAFTAALALLCWHGAEAETVYEEFTGRIAVEGRGFPQSTIHDGQREQSLSLVAEPELYLEGENGNSLTIQPFYRYDSADPRRTHFDVREAYGLFLWEALDSDWELRVGVDKVFWGVAESRHLVDVINQTDVVEHPDLEEKLGQPMAHLTWVNDWGIVELFALPYFRERTFPGRSGRLRTPLLVDTSNPQFESAAEEWHFDMAARYSHSIDIFDFGVAIFDGTNREPNLTLGLDRYGAPVLVPLYEQMRQYSVDAQMTTGPWLVKLEAYWRDGEKDAFLVEEDYAAVVTGFEYTFFGAFDSDTDIGLLGEWLFDERDKRANNPFENDLFAGVRVALNDAASTDFLFGVIQDLDTTTRNLALEANRRLSDNWSLSLEGLAFLNVTSDDPQFGVRKDSFVQAELSYNF